MLRHRGIGALVVTTATNPVSGIPSERDIVLASAEQGPSVLTERSHEYDLASHKLHTHRVAN